jgi:hypothetical protein
MNSSTPWRVAEATSIALICALLLVSYVSPALTSTVNISTSGVIVANNEVTLQSGSPADIQVAVNQISAQGGGTVYLAAGTFDFNDETVQIPGGVNIIGAGMGNTILRQNKAAPFNAMFYLDGRNGGRMRISGIEFRGLVTVQDDNLLGMAIDVRYGIDFRIDHCKFLDFPNAAISVINNVEGTDRGVIDHNVIDNPYKVQYGGATPPYWGYGIIIAGNNANWHSDISLYLGKYEDAPIDTPMVYIEDNSFSHCRHAIASNQAAWYVARYNTIVEQYPRNYQAIDIHGDAGGGKAGGRGFEVYGNTITAPAGYPAAVAVGIRGGGGIIWNNNFINNFVNVRLLADNPNEAYQVNDLYIWGNTIQGGSGALIDNMAGYTENQDYFLYARSGYTQYPYPHPMTLEGAP